MSTNTKAISDEIRQAAYDCARGIYLNVDDGGTPYMTDDDILEVAKAIHDAVMAERERYQWQPIETAPKDGTIILLVGGVYGGLPFPGKWDKSEFVSPVARWFSSINNSHLYNHVPTHWQPLPAAPKSEG